VRPEQLFHLLGDRTRLSIVGVLDSKRAGLSVGEIAGAVGSKEPSVSQHLKLLSQAGLVAGHRRGRQVVYRLDPRTPGLVSDLAKRLPGSRRPPRMRLSARNRLMGKVTAVERDRVASSVTLDVGGQTVQAVITTAALDDLGLAVGDSAYAVIKATEVMLMK
jgi:molybdopterin-binding protein